MSDKKYTKMVISGGGINGIAIVGAISEFSKYYDINEIKEIIGVSVGSVIAILIAVGYEMNEIENIFEDIEMDKFTEYDLENVFYSYGVDSGEMSKRLLKAVVVNKKYDVGLTFKQLYEKRGIKLIITVTNITLGRAEYLCMDNHPNMPIVDAVRISMSFPLMYTPVEYEKNMYIDGGVLAPYPIEYFEGSEDVIGFLINRSGKRKYDTDSLDKYLYSLLFIILDVYQDKHYIGYEDNTVFMEKKDLIENVLSFNLTKEIKKDLMEKGKKCFAKYIANKKL